MPEKLKKALQYLQSAKFQQAIAYFQECFHQKKNLPKAKYYENMLHLCIAYFQVDKLQKAKQICQKVLQQSFCTELASLYFAMILSHMKQFNQALKICNKSIQLNDQQWSVYYAKGYVLIQMAKYQEASQNLGLAITRNKLNNPKSYIFQALCLINLNDVQNACKNIHYATLAMQEDQAKNCKQFYKYEIKNIKEALKTYKKYKKKIQKGTQQKIIESNEQKTMLQNLIKIVGRSIMYCSTVYNIKRLKRSSKQKKFPTQNNQIKNENTSQNSDNLSNIQNKQQQINNFLYEQLSKIDQMFSFRSKNSITTQSMTLQKNNNICQWLKQKCCIF